MTALLCEFGPPILQSISPRIHLTNRHPWVSVEEIRSIAERHKQENPNLSLIMADYLGLIEKPKADRNDLAIAHISGSLKAMAKDLKTPVISLSQLSRDVEKRPNKRPTNADLRDSGSIEQDADSIIMLYQHMKSELKRLQELRAHGVTGRIDFTLPDWYQDGIQLRMGESQCAA